MAKKSAKTKPPANASAPTAPTAPADSCFVIMPFCQPFDTYYKLVYKPAIEAAGLRPERADGLGRSSRITDDIWRYTVGAKVVLAELTTKNANVFYELGLAHAAQKPALLVSQTMDDVPFDLKSLRTVLYNTLEPYWAENLAKQITASLKETLEAPLSFVVPTYLEVTHESTEVGEMEELRIELDSLRREVRSLVNSRTSLSPWMKFPVSPSDPDRLQVLLAPGAGEGDGTEDNFIIRGSSWLMPPDPAGQG